MILGEQASFSNKLTGKFPVFNSYGGGRFLYQYQSSNYNVISFEQKSIKTKYNNPITQNITARGLGKTTITVKAWATNEDIENSGSYYIGELSFDVEVVDNLDPTGISLSETEILTHVGENTTVEAILTPDDVRTNVSWSSSDESIATVNNGKITRKGRGNAVIQATTSNGLLAKCYVTVLGEEDYHHVKIGDLYYDLNRNDMTATVVHERDFYAEDEDAYFEKEENNYIQGDVVVPSNVNWFDREFKVNKIGRSAFYQCDITFIQMPNTLISIDGGAFYETKLTNIIIPESVNTIG